ncbi:type II toxin-antitoxin system VapC family toxin [Pseudonocardia nigra]|uniref:type II toxin-antitoxin system VapC family toxin n=1 Tax=Pseudonocardia nigra TaxID=1921578 RepID=UPI001C5FDC5B|nr:type II toxin-antitoxin system VapC family toxin [Pseudonocardia nigra]
MKLYADEPGNEMVRALGQLLVAQIARVEVPAALWRKHRMGEVSATAVGLLVGEFEADWFAADPPRLAVVRMTSLVIENAARLTGGHELRAYDAVQLASALAVRAADPDVARFAAFDRTLRAAAVAEGFTLVG